MINDRFEAKVLTHLEYIKKKQEEHDKQFASIIEKFENHKVVCIDKFNCINTRIDKAEGFAKGAVWVGSLGVFGGIVSMLSRMFKW